LINLQSFVCVGLGRNFDKNLTEMLDFTCRTVFFIVFSIFSTSIWAQVDGFAFTETLRSGEGRLDGINVIKQLAEGDYIVGGEFRGTKDFDPGEGRVVRSTRSSTTTNPFIARYSAAGELVWVRHLRSGSTTELRSLDLDDAGNVYALGSFGDLFYADENDLTQVLIDNPQPNADLWVVSYTANGVFRWAERLGGDGVDSGTALVVNGNSLVLCGVFGQSMDIDPGPGTFEVSTGGQSGQLTFVASYTKDSFEFEWGFQIGGAVVSFDLIHAISRDDSGNLYITGAFRLTKDFDPSPDSEFLLVSDGSNDDVFVASYTSGGAFRWARRAGDGGADFGRGISVMDGTVYVTGEFRFTSVFEGDLNTETLVSSGNQDAFVALYSSGTGELTDVFKIGSTGNDSGQGIERFGDQLLVTGNYAATANFNPNGEAAEFTATSLNGFLASYNVNDLTLNWMSDIQSAGTSYVTDVVESNGILRAVGRFTNTTDFDPSVGEAIVVPVRNNDSDFFLVDYSTSTGAYQAVFSGEDQPGGNVDVTAVAALPSGGAVASGNFTGRLFFEDGNAIDVTGNGGYLTRFGETGGAQATARLQATTSAFMTGVEADANGNVYAIGYFTGNAAFFHAGGELSLAANANQSRMVVFKLNADLELLWHREFEGTQLQIATHLAVNEDRIVFTGNFRGNLSISDGVVLESAGNADGFVASFSHEGDYQWAFRFGSTSNLDGGQRVGFDSDGNVLLVARIVFTVNMDPSGNADPLVGSGENTIVVAAYSPAGDYLWANLQSGAITASAIAAVDANRFVLYASFSNSATLGSLSVNETLVSQGSTDLFIALYDNGGDLDTAYVVAAGPGTDVAGELIVNGNEFLFTGWIRNETALFDNGNPILESTVPFNNGFYARTTLTGAWVEGFLMSNETNGIEPKGISLAANEVYIAGTFGTSFGDQFSFTGSDAFIGRLGESSTPECAGDFDNDGIVAASDLLILLAEFGCASSCAADLSGDDQTNVSDVLLFLSLFGTTCN
jgi:hypothetical protein